MTDWSAFYELFGVWPVAQPYAKVMFEEQEVMLVLGLGKRNHTMTQISLALSLELEATQALVDRCYRRSIVDKHLVDKHRVDKQRVDKQRNEYDIVYQITDFYTFLDYYIKYEKWDSIPIRDRRAIDRKYLQEFIARVEEDVALKKNGKTTQNALPNDSLMLLHEVEAMIDAATNIVVQPCDCRRSGQFCHRPVETCIWLDEVALSALDRGQGRVISNEEARHLLRSADQKGLMHTADSEWREKGLHVICNCCACDCFPFRAAAELGSKGVWPKSRYIAEYNSGVCSQCAACVKRCHFDAFFHDGSFVKIDGKSKKRVSFDPQKCWGCGLCANTCPTEAIVMKPIDA